MINPNKWKWLRLFVTLNKDEDAYCDFIYNQDMKEHRINLTDHYNENYMYDMNKKIGIQINETFIMNYSPEHSNEIYEIMTKLIDLFINSSEYDDPQIYRQKYLFKECRSNKLLIESINLLSVAYLDWLMFEIENNKKLKNEGIHFNPAWDNTTFINIVESTYKHKNIENAIWNECNYKKSNELIEYEFYNGSVINLLKHPIWICKKISMLLVYLYKYHKKVQHFYTEFNGHNFDEFSDSIVQSFRENNLTFEGANFDIIYLTLCNN